MVLIDNPNDAAIEVLVDGEFVGTVRAGSTGRFGPFERGEHRVVTRYRNKARHLTMRTSRDYIEVRGRRPARIQADHIHKGIVNVRNQWIQPMRVLVDGVSVGTVRAGATLGAFAGESTIELRDPRGNLALRTRVSLSGLNTTSVTLDPAPHGYVTIRNPASHAVEVHADHHGDDHTRIRPGRSTRLRLSTGWTTLMVTHHGETVDSRKILVSPFVDNGFDIRVPRTGSRTFRNENRVGSISSRPSVRDGRGYGFGHSHSHHAASPPRRTSQRSWWSRYTWNR
jgi:hypothetical protein